MSNISSLILLGVIAANVCLPNFALADIQDWQKGASIYPTKPTDFGSDGMKAVLQQLSDDHVNTVTLVIPYYQKRYNTVEIFPGVDTPTDESLTQAISWAHQLGLDVVLKPHLDSGGSIWRANIYPKDRDTWYTNYENMLLHYAAIAQVYNVEQICIGTELISMASQSVNSDNTIRWKKMISNLRNRYNGKLTYSANWGPASSAFANEKDHIGFWDDLDYIGISAYFQLASKDNSVESVMDVWSKWDQSDITPLYQKYNKPIVFTEVGYRSSKNSIHAPYEYQKIGIYDDQEQSNAYDALMGYWNDKPHLAGISIWDFYANPQAGGEGNTDYTPQNKPAEEIIRKWFLPRPVAVLELPAPKPEPTITPNVYEQGFTKLNDLLKSVSHMPLRPQLITYGSI